MQTVFNWIIYIALVYMAGNTRFTIGKTEVYCGPLRNDSEVSE